MEALAILGIVVPLALEAGRGFFKHKVAVRTLKADGAIYSSICGYDKLAMVECGLKSHNSIVRAKAEIVIAHHYAIADWLDANEIIQGHTKISAQAKAESFGPLVDGLQGSFLSLLDSIAAISAAHRLHLDDTEGDKERPHKKIRLLSNLTADVQPTFDRRISDDTQRSLTKLSQAARKLSKTPLQQADIEQAQENLEYAIRHLAF